MSFRCSRVHCEPYAGEGAVRRAKARGTRVQAELRNRDLASAEAARLGCKLLAIHPRQSRTRSNCCRHPPIELDSRRKRRRCPLWAVSPPWWRSWSGPSRAFMRCAANDRAVAISSFGRCVRVLPRQVYNRSVRAGAAQLGFSPPGSAQWLEEMSAEMVVNRDASAANRTAAAAKTPAAGRSILPIARSSLGPDVARWWLAPSPSGSCRSNNAQGTAVVSFRMRLGSRPVARLKARVKCVADE